MVLRSAGVVRGGRASSVLTGDVYQSCVSCNSVSLTNTDQLWLVIVLGLPEHSDFLCRLQLNGWLVALGVFAEPSPVVSAT